MTQGFALKYELCGYGGSSADRQNVVRVKLKVKVKVKVVVEVIL